MFMSPVMEPAKLLPHWVNTSSAPPHKRLPPPQLLAQSRLFPFPTASRAAPGCATKPQGDQTFALRFSLPWGGGDPRPGSAGASPQPLVALRGVEPSGAVSIWDLTKIISRPSCPHSTTK